MYIYMCVNMYIYTHTLMYMCMCTYMCNAGPLWLSHTQSKQMPHCKYMCICMFIYV